MSLDPLAENRQFGIVGQSFIRTKCRVQRLIQDMNHTVSRVYISFGVRNLHPLDVIASPLIATVHEPEIIALLREKRRGKNTNAFPDIFTFCTCLIACDTALID